jgi:hypothetical protein
MDGRYNCHTRDSRGSLLATFYLTPFYKPRKSFFSKRLLFRRDYPRASGYEARKLLTRLIGTPYLSANSSGSEAKATDFSCKTCIFNDTINVITVIGSIYALGSMARHFCSFPFIARVTTSIYRIFITIYFLFIYRKLLLDFHYIICSRFLLL